MLQEMEGLEGRGEGEKRSEDRRRQEKNGRGQGEMRKKP